MPTSPARARCWPREMAVEDFGAAAKGMKVEIVGADHQNKPDVGSNVARQWYRRRQGRRDRRRADLGGRARGQRDRPRARTRCSSSPARPRPTSPASARPTRSTGPTTPGRSPTAPARRIVKTGGDTWFFLTADYAFGHALERDTAAVVEKNGGKVLGKVRHPLHRPATSRPSCCRRRPRRPRSSASPMPAATPSTRSSRRPSSASSQGGQNLAGLLVFITDVHALGLQTAQGLIMTETWYWDLNDDNRAFAKHFAAAQQGHASDHGPCRRLLGGHCTISRRSRR